MFIYFRFINSLRYIICRLPMCMRLYSRMECISKWSTRAFGINLHAIGRARIRSRKL